MKKMTCKTCVDLTDLIKLGAVSKCGECGTIFKKPVTKSEIITIDTYTPPSKIAPNRKPITRKHWDAMYNKYNEDWGIVPTIKWLEKKFYVIN